MKKIKLMFVLMFLLLIGCSKEEIKPEPKIIQLANEYEISVTKIYNSYINKQLDYEEYIKQEINASRNLRAKILTEDLINIGVYSDCSYMFDSNILILTVTAPFWTPTPDEEYIRKFTPDELYKIQMDYINQLDECISDVDKKLSKY